MLVPALLAGLWLVPLASALRHACDGVCPCAGYCASRESCHEQDAESKPAGFSASCSHPAGAELAGPTPALVSAPTPQPQLAWLGPAPPAEAPPTPDPVPGTIPHPPPHDSL